MAWSSTIFMPRNLGMSKQAMIGLLRARSLLYRSRFVLQVHARFAFLDIRFYTIFTLLHRSRLKNNPQHLTSFFTYLTSTFDEPCQKLRNIGHILVTFCQSVRFFLSILMHVHFRILIHITSYNPSI